MQIGSNFSDIKVVLFMVFASFRDKLLEKIAGDQGEI
jgi:hypothetical protein